MLTREAYLAKLSPSAVPHLFEKSVRRFPLNMSSAKWPGGIFEQARALPVIVAVAVSAIAVVARLRRRRRLSRPSNSSRRPCPRPTTTGERARTGPNQKGERRRRLLSLYSSVPYVFGELAISQVGVSSVVAICARQAPRHARRHQEVRRTRGKFLRGNERREYGSASGRRRRRGESG